MAVKKAVRGFRVVRKQFKMSDEKTTIPVRADAKSAGYDFYSKETYTLAPNQTHIFWTDIKAYMQPDEVLLLYVRSSLGIKRGAVLANGTGVIDASYYGNQNNDGNIGVAIRNDSRKPITIKAGERIAQGVFTKYLLADVDNVLSNERIGGIGSSGAN